jgi:hypothetical protein
VVSQDFARSGGRLTPLYTEVNGGNGRSLITLPQSGLGVVQRVRRLYCVERRGFRYFFYLLLPTYYCDPLFQA